MLKIFSIFFLRIHQFINSIGKNLGIVLPDADLDVAAEQVCAFIDMRVMVRVREV